MFSKFKKFLMVNTYSNEDILICGRALKYSN